MKARLTGAALAAVVSLAACGDDNEQAAATTAAPATTVQATTTAAATVTTTAPDTTVTTPAPATTTAATPTTATAAPGDTAARAAYQRRADALCRASNAAARRLNERANTAIRTAKSDADRLEALVPILEAGLTRQRADLQRFLAIAPPAADRAVIERYWATLKRQGTVVARLLAAARAGDVQQYSAVADESATLRDESRAMARAYGFRECGSGKSDAA